MNEIEKNSIYQSNKLIEASYQMTTIEQKLIRIVASTISDDDDYLRKCVFNVSNLSKLLNANEKNIYREIDRATTSLMSKIIKVKIDDKKWSKYNLLQYAKYSDGILEIKINDNLKEFYINLNEYTKYRLENILKFKYKHSFRIYELLKQYEKLKKRSITIEDLKTILGFSSKQYKIYSDFKNRVLLSSIGEINSVTDLVVTFKEIKLSRKINSIEFYIQKKAHENSTQMKEIEKFEFTELESIVQNIKNTVGVSIDQTVIKSLLDEYGKERINYYLQNWYKFSTLHLRNKAGFFIKCIQRKYYLPEEQAGKPVQSTNYKQREYDDDHYESLYDKL